MFTSDPLFWKSLYNTFYITVIGVPLNILVAFGIALFLNMKVRGMAYYRTIYYLPAVVPVVASSVLWLWILNPRFGVLNAALALVRIKGPMWLASESWSKPSIILMSLWGAGATMIIYLAGLQGIPEQLYEAAEIDGANWWHRFWKITLPLMTPTLFFTVIMGIISSMQVFTQAYIMTNGGPVDSTLFYVYYLFNNAFAYFRMGYACASAWILFLIILIITFFQLRMARYWVYYEAGGKR
jgi:multiple sugar transport system permease protein